MKPGVARISICLFRNDLRVHDNEALLWAHKNSDHILPVYCFDPDHFKGSWHFKFPKTGAHRAKFLHQSIVNLRTNLESVGSCLYVEHARPADTVRDLVKRLSDSKMCVTSLVYQKEVTYEELKVEEKLKEFCKQQDINVKEVWGSTLYHHQDLPFSEGCTKLPDTYTQFRKEVEGRCSIRPVLEMPSSLHPPPPLDRLSSAMPDLTSLGVKEDMEEDKRTAFPFKGGETAGLDRLQDYLWGSHAVAQYKETRNGLVGEAYSTKFSPWLSLGSISPRMVFKMIKKYEKEVVANKSTYWVIFELLWRDYFKFVCLKYGKSVFLVTGILNRDHHWSQDKGKFHAWAEGRTGVPFVDANMRELKETGWMSNRGRQNVASFLVKDLGLDWRLGAEWFESLLLDHDVCSNYGNWNYAAGIGNDPRENRKFNMIKQGMDYDGEGKFVRLWVPELAGLPGSKVHFPWTLPSGELSRADVDLGVSYPKPMVVAPEWSRHTGGGNGGGYRGNSRGGFGVNGRGNQRRPAGQRDIQSYMQSPRVEPENLQSTGQLSSAGRGRGRPPLRGGRVQY